MSKATKRKAAWMSMDCDGDSAGVVQFWDKEPRGEAGGFYAFEGGKERNSLDHMNSDCDEFRRFCGLFGISPPKPGELVKLTVKVQSKRRLSTQSDVVRRLRSAKKFDRPLLVEAAAWVESISDGTARSE